MDFGLVLQTDPPAREVVALMRRAEEAGFRYGWTFDSAVLWQEPFVILSQVLAQTRELRVGPMVTNPGTRSLEVTASTFATLNEMFGNRTVCGIGRGDSAMRVAGRAPNSLATLRQAVDAIRDLAEGREAVLDGVPVRIPWVVDGRLPVWVAAYGPKALALTGELADGFILQLADVFLTEWMTAAVRVAATAAGRDHGEVTVCVAAPAYVTRDDSPAALAHAREQCRWFGGMVGNHVADLVARYGTETGMVPEALTAYITGRAGYDYGHHGRSGHPDAAFVPDEIVDRFCLLGPPEAHIAKLRRLRALGVDQFAVYAMHDERERVIDVYGEHVIPALAEDDGRGGGDEGGAQRGAQGGAQGGEVPAAHARRRPGGPHR
ncbi:TIGR03842 family LLM class F420-dependent oxidoreductase [Streptomyces radicis]|uniref:TIGR03842 family LLM class F420-dependent oxidoreductase n=1 Tax=Streptomyces radicis TaxID=1750517 RepID=A0A3A9WLG7_9ACTN|nr:TIGR03842 family LLM class F420-dependent oxidoreductase [Streptomyces radicis]RKN06997.1 TIGR03842 family LLM class F420-dependent oxidoreductase [Streptomyces radicis]RKN15863.1 TIGR03842 family LLM class F420-dependent oxidoreductase [Streptomyces radicis]